MSADSLADAEAALWSATGVLQPAEHRLQLAGLGTTVRVLDVGEGPPILFVHGTSVAGPSWAELVGRLEGFRCLLLDRPGCGRSDPYPHRIGVAELPFVADQLVAEVLDAMDLPTAHIVATSLGGYFALRAAAAHPNRLQRMVLFGWTLGMPGSRAPLWLRLGSVPPLPRLSSLVPPSPGSVRAILRQFGMRRAIDEGHLSDEAVHWLVTLYRETGTLRNESEGGQGLLTLRGGWVDEVFHSDELLASISSPTCVVWGEDDPFADVEAAQSLVARMPDAELHVVPRAGHAPWLDALDETAALTARFLSGQPTQARHAVPRG